MAGIERTRIRELANAERAEVEAAMQAPPPRSGSAAGPAGFLADNDDVVALWLLGLTAGVGGIVVYFVGGIPMAYARETIALAGLAVLGWTAWVAITTWRRRGVVFTTSATWRVRGQGLVGVRHADVEAIAFRVIRTRKQTFSVLELFAPGGKKLTLYCHRPWAEAAIASIQKARGGAVPVRDR